MGGREVESGGVQVDISISTLFLLISQVAIHFALSHTQCSRRHIRLYTISNSTSDYIQYEILHQITYNMKFLAGEKSVEKTLVMVENYTLGDQCFLYLLSSVE